MHVEQRDGTLRTVAQAAFGADGSLYLVPYASRGDYWYGEELIAAGQPNFEIRFKEHVFATARPKLSVHWTGDVHVYADGAPKAGPVKSLPLPTSRGHHVASVQIDHIEQLPVYTRRTKTTGEKVDVAFGLPSDVAAGRLLVYANAERNEFHAAPMHFSLRVERLDGQGVWFGFQGVANDALGLPPEGGISVLAGFDARKPPGEEQRFLFLRGI